MSICAILGEIEKYTNIDAADEQYFEYAQQLFTRNRLTIYSIYFEKLTLKLINGLKLL